LEVLVITGFSLLTFGKVAEMLIQPVLENVEHPELTFREVAKMLIHPMLENVEHPELI
jgi:hypothetical protein